MALVPSIMTSPKGSIHRALHIFTNESTYGLMQSNIVLETNIVTTSAILSLTYSDFSTI